MADITAAMVKELREKSGAGIMDCKAALGECDGDLEKAVDFLRKKGIARTMGGMIRWEMKKNVISLFLTKPSR